MEIKEFKYLLKHIARIYWRIEALEHGEGQFKKIVKGDTLQKLIDEIKYLRAKIDNEEKAKKQENKELMKNGR